MSIQNSINRVLYYAGAYKIASTRNKYWNSKTNSMKTPKAGVKTEASKRQTMRERAFSSAMDEGDARRQQLEYFGKIYKGEFDFTNE